VSNDLTSRRRFLKMAGAAGAGLFGSGPSVRLAATLVPRFFGPLSAQSETGPPDYTLRIEASAIEIAPTRIVSAITYNGQFPGPLLRFKEGQAVTVDVHNDTDTPEQLHWHGQKSDIQTRAERDTDDVSNLCSFRKASAARSPIMTQGAMVLPVVTRGMMDPSAIRSFSIP
jgi:FtsP/CotA-like multicopper oxidase with cupredoxin domain